MTARSYHPVECPKCGHDDTVRSGGGRIFCKGCKRSSWAHDGTPSLGGVDVSLADTSTLYKRTDAESGEPILQWVKFKADRERARQALQVVADAMREDLPREPARPKPKLSASALDLLNLYVITDYHLGMLSWHEETGEDWDMRIAEDMIYVWFARAIERSPPAAVGVFAQLGDFLHWDGLDAVTPASKHVLDADTRWPKVVRVAIRVMRRVVRMLLDRHAQVILVVAEGNHDEASSVAMREWMAALYEDEPRVTVDTSVDPYYCVEHGDTSLFFHHGHKRKPNKIDDVFAAKFRSAWGRTKKSYAHMGHMHHVDARETNLMIVEQHRTLAAKDAYASRGGWMAGRDAKVITYHNRWGEIQRITISADELIHETRAA